MIKSAQSGTAAPALRIAREDGRKRAKALHAGYNLAKNLERPAHSRHPENRQPGGVRIDDLHPRGRPAHPEDRRRSRHRCEDRRAIVHRLHVSLCAGAAGAGRVRRSFRQNEIDEFLFAGGGAGGAGLRGGDELFAPDRHAGCGRMRRRRPVSDRARADRRSGAGAATASGDRAAPGGRPVRQSRGGRPLPA
jgi:hypothetical protein